MEKIIKEIKKEADRIKYGKLTIDFIISRGEIVKVVIKGSEKVVLLERR